MHKTTALVFLFAAWCCTKEAAGETVVGRYVNVSIPGQGKILSLAEVQVFSAGENVAQGKKTGQTSIGSDGDASRAVDGNTSGDWDYDACCLPDDRIIYDSTACFQGVPCVGGNMTEVYAGGGVKGVLRGTARCSR